MKLKDVIAKLREELRDAGVSTRAGTQVELHVLLKETSSGITCDVVDGGAMSSIRAESLHRLVVRLDGSDATHSHAHPVATEATTGTKLSTSRNRIDSATRMLGSPTEVAFVDDDNVDDPAIFRRAIAVEGE